VIAMKNIMCLEDINIKIVHRCNDEDNDPSRRTFKMSEDQYVVVEASEC